MVGIKNLAQLSLSRPSSQPPVLRTSTDSPRHSPDSPQPEPVGRPKCHDDYYLSDDQLVLPQRSSHSKGQVPSATNVRSSQSTTPNLAVTSVSTSSTKSNKIAVSAKSQALISSTPTTSVINNSSIQTSQSATHKNLISNLRSVSTKPFPTITRNATPLCSRPGSPPYPTNNVSPTSTYPITLHQLEASYVSKVGARLQGLIDQVFPSSIENGLVWMGRGAPRPSNALELGKALHHEFEVSSCDLYILRSLLRTAAIPALTVFAGRLHLLLILPANETSVLYVPKSAKDLEHSLPVTLRYNIEVIRCAWSAYSSVGNILKIKDWSPETTKVLRDALAPFLSKMDAIIQQFMGPYLLEIKKQVMACILKCQLVESNSLSPPKGHHPLGRTIPALGGYGGWITPTHPPEPLRELTNLLEGIRKLLMVKVACGAESKCWMVSVATHVVWKGLLFFATSAFPMPTSCTHLQAVQPPRAPPTASVAHLIDSYSSAFGLKGAKNILHPGKRSPSPPLKPDSTAFHHELLVHLKVFSSVVNDFVKEIATLDPHSKKHRPSCTSDCELCNQGFLVNSGGDGDLVEEAMKEALEALSALQLVALSLQQPSCLKRSLIACAQSLGLSSSSANWPVDKAQFECPTLIRALQELPPFILIHLIASRISKQAGFRLPHQVWGDSWMVYQEELKGFMAAERWLPEVAHQMAKEVRRIQRLQPKAPAANDETKEASKSPGDTNHDNLDSRQADDMEWMSLLMFSIQIFVAS